MEKDKTKNQKPPKILDHFLCVCVMIVGCMQMCQLGPWLSLYRLEVKASRIFQKFMLSLILLLSFRHPFSKITLPGGKPILGQAQLSFFLSAHPLILITLTAATYVWTPFHSSQSDWPFVPCLDSHTTTYLLISLYLVILDISEIQICVYVIIKIQSMPFQVQSTTLGFKIIFI